MKKVLIISIIALFFSHCDCEDPEYLLPDELPNLFLVSSIQATEPYLRIEFNQALNFSTIELADNLIIKSGSSVYGGSYEVDTKAILIPLCDLPCAEFVENDQLKCPYNIQIRDIESIAGQILDGDVDGKEGGLFVDSINTPAIDGEMNFNFDTILICPLELAELNPGTFDTYIWSTMQTSPTIRVAEPGTYSVTLTSDNSSCPIVGTALVIPMPLDSFTAGPDFLICALSDTFPQLNASGGCNYSWSPTIGLSSFDTPDPFANPPTTTTYTVSSLDATGAVIASDEVVVTVVDNFADAGVTPAPICQGESIQLQASGGVEYFWFSTSDLDNPTISNPIATPFFTTTYTVEVVDENGCRDTDTVTAKVDTCIFTIDFVEGPDSTKVDTNHVKICFTEIPDPSTIIVGGNITFTFDTFSNLTFNGNYQLDGKCIVFQNCALSCEFASIDCLSEISVLSENDLIGIPPIQSINKTKFGFDTNGDGIVEESYFAGTFVFQQCNF